MEWKQVINQPSFRGVSFEVESDELSGGRRIVTHEYPLRDESNPEDMGRKQREFSVEGFVFGSDYQSKRNQLMLACEESGPGVLVHPQYGRLTVVCTGFRVHHVANELGKARFTMTFQPAGKSIYPGSSMRTQDALFAKSGAAFDTAVTQFDSRFCMTGLPSFASESAFDEVAGAIETVVGTRVSAASDEVFSRAAWQLESLTPAGLSLLQPGTALSALFQEDSATMPEELSGAALRMEEMLSLAGQASARVVPSLYTPSRIAMAENTNAVSEFLRQAATAQACRSASAVVPDTKVDAERMSALLTEAVDAVLENTLDDEIYLAFGDLRAVVVKDLAERASKSKLLRSFSPTMPGPALVMAHRFCDGGGREVDDLILRNNVPHPGFVGIDPLEVVTNG